MIYLDNSATSYPKPEEVYKKLDNLNRYHSFNSGRGIHKAAEDSRRIIEESRTLIASLAGRKKPQQVIFTSSSTDALNTIIFGLGLKNGSTVYVSPFEHNAIVRPLKNINGIHVHVLPFDSDWNCQIDQLGSLFCNNKPTAILMSQVSNVTGIETPYSEVFNFGKKYGSINILDCSQSYGILDINTDDLDYAVFDGHKSLYAAFGVGGFIQYNNDYLEPTKFGGNGSDSLSPNLPDKGPLKYEIGSMNLPAIGSLTASIPFLKKGNYSKKLFELARYTAENLRKIQGVTVYLPENRQSLGIVSFNLDGYNSNELSEILDEDFDITIRGGYHCSPLIHDFIDSRQYFGTARASFGIFSTKNDADKLISAIKELSEEIQ